MRIAQVAPLAESVPPKLYGGTERIVSYLADELVALGHDVTLFASGDSVTDAALDPVCPRALRLDPACRDPRAPQALLLERVARRAAEFDVIHFHADWMHLPLFSRLGVPFLTTAHGRLDLAETAAVLRRFDWTPLVSISDAQREPVPGANWLGTVHHGLPDGLLRPCSAPSGGYLAFLGRISPEKQPHVAIRLARAAGWPIRLAAKVDAASQGYFDAVVRPLLGQPGVEFIGEISEGQKAEFLGNAAALLFPIDWPEPFGMVMIEAMACGTPVVAFGHGSVPEVIEDGASGFIVDDEAAAMAAIESLPLLCRARVRQAFEARFTSRRMAEDYLRLYRVAAGMRPAPHQGLFLGPASDVDETARRWTSGDTSQAEVVSLGGHRQPPGRTAQQGMGSEAVAHVRTPDGGIAPVRTAPTATGVGPSRRRRHPTLGSKGVSQ
jgi:glycosyltransferase involved in cell wall biosynthesis